MLIGARDRLLWGRWEPVSLLCNVYPLVQSETMKRVLCFVTVLEVVVDGIGTLQGDLLDPCPDGSNRGEKVTSAILLVAHGL